MEDCKYSLIIWKLFSYYRFQLQIIAFRTLSIVLCINVRLVTPALVNFLSKCQCATAQAFHRISDYSFLVVKIRAALLEIYWSTAWNACVEPQKDWFDSWITNWLSSISSSRHQLTTWVVTWVVIQMLQIRFICPQSSSIIEEVITDTKGVGWHCFVKCLAGMSGDLRRQRGTSGDSPIQTFRRRDGAANIPP